MVGTTDVDVEQAVVGLRAKANAEQVAALGNDAVGEGMAGLGAPIGLVARLGTGRKDVIKSMGKQGEEAGVPLLHIGELGGDLGRSDRHSCSAFPEQ